MHTQKSPRTADSLERIANNGHNYKRKFQVEADAAKETVLADLRGIEDFRFAAPRPLLAKIPLTKKWDGTMIMGISVGVKSLGPKGRQNPVKARWEKG